MSEVIFLPLKIFPSRKAAASQFSDGEFFLKCKSFEIWMIPHLQCSKEFLRISQIEKRKKIQLKTWRGFIKYVRVSRVGRMVMPRSERQKDIEVWRGSVNASRWMYCKSWNYTGSCSVDNGENKGTSFCPFLITGNHWKGDWEMVMLSRCQEQDSSFSWSILIPSGLEREGFNYRDLR